MSHVDFEETPDLIASNKVEGASVFTSEGEKLGSIHALIVNKRSGQVIYAVLRIGGVMGIGADYQFLPWDSLDFDHDLDGYVAEMEDDAQPASTQSGDMLRFNYALGTEPIGHYGLDNPEEPVK